MVIYLDNFVFLDFATPNNTPGLRTRKVSPLDILQIRYASGIVTTEEYQEKKRILETI